MLGITILGRSNEADCRIEKYVRPYVLKNSVRCVVAKGDHHQGNTVVDLEGLAGEEINCTFTNYGTRITCIW